MATLRLVSKQLASTTLERAETISDLWSNSHLLLVRQLTASLDSQSQQQTRQHMTACLDINMDGGQDEVSSVGAPLPGW